MHKAFPLPGESFHWQYKFPLPVKVVPTARRIEIPLPGVCTAIEEMMKKLQSKIDSSYTKIVPHVLPMILAVTVKENQEKDKIRQKREAWRSRKKSKAVTVKKERKIKETAS
nr:hypothetical protein [Tanacetum cinerariifolium]